MVRENLREQEKRQIELERGEYFTCLNCKKQFKVITPTGLNSSDLKLYCLTCQQNGSKRKWTCSVCHQKSEKMHEH